MKVAAVFGNRIFADERKDRGSLWMTHVDPKFKDGILTGDKGGEAHRSHADEGRD